MDSKPKNSYKTAKGEHLFTMEDTLQFISKIEACPLLWNKRDPQYKDVAKQDNVWQKVASELSILVLLAKEKWQNLRSTYRKNRIKVNNSIQSGAGCNEIFRPNWFAYEAMQFLNENLSAGDTIDTLRPPKSLVHRQNLEATSIPSKIPRLSPSSSVTNLDGAVPSTSKNKGSLGQHIPSTSTNKGSPGIPSTSPGQTPRFQLMPGTSIVRGQRVQIMSNATSGQALRFQPIPVMSTSQAAPNTFSGQIPRFQLVPSLSAGVGTQVQAQNDTSTGHESRGQPVPITSTDQAVAVQSRSNTTTGIPETDQGVRVHSELETSMNEEQEEQPNNASSQNAPRLSRQARVDGKILSCLEYLESSYQKMQEREPVSAFLDLVAERMLRRKKEDLEKMQNEILQVIERFEIDDKNE
uniref:uncharacterized protein LOC120956712 n=1 Tax=Anopheles coluzzii TaxID=1518534 RepID=UPI0020FFC798|nr:uncharacterized protein LOC120956712 [Anopheles coluzzii]